MFVGHYGPALALKRVAPETPLAALFLGVQLVDIAWACFIFTGVEQVRIVPGFTASNPLDLFYMPYTHSLTGALLWSLGAAGIMWLFARSRRAALAVALAVLSHWLLDLFMHVPDLPLFGNEHKVGLGLWNYRWPAFALELVSLFGGLAIYVRVTRARDRIGALGPWLFAVALTGAQLYNLLGPPPPTPSAMAGAALAAYLAFAAVAHWIDRHRDTA
jgi:hypothetical protein